MYRLTSQTSKVAAMLYYVFSYTHYMAVVSFYAIDMSDCILNW